MVATAPGADAVTRALLWRQVAGRPLAAWPLQALARLADVGFCALVTPLERYDDGIKAIQNAAPDGIKAVIPTASATWRRALACVEDIPMSFEWIIALDATEPLVTTAALRAGLDAATRTGVAIACEPVKETLKRTQGQMVIETPPRASLMRLFAPVVFQRAALARALAAPAETAETAPADADDLVALAQRSGAPLSVFAAGFPGVRLTAEDDLALIETLLTQRQAEAKPI